MSLRLVAPHLPAGQLLATPIVARMTGAGGLRRARLHLSGELDIVASPQLEQTLQQVEFRGRRVELDLREVTFMDSSAVRVIVYATIRARRAGGRLTLLHVGPQVHRILTVTGAAAVVEIGDLQPIDTFPQPVHPAAA